MNPMLNRLVPRKFNRTSRTGFTLIELLLTVTVLLILAGLVIPAYVNSEVQIRRSQLTYNLKLIRNAIDIYTIEHEGRTPAIRADGSIDTLSSRFIRRLSDRSWKSGGVDVAGPLGPYVFPWPSNPVCPDSDNKEKVRIDSLAPGIGNRGWHYNTDSVSFRANTPDHTAL